MEGTNRAKNVVDFYVLCTRLKDVIRTGWKRWDVKRDRIESVAEHIFGVQSLAIAMWSEYKYDIDFYKVIFMIAVHELEEVVIGDLTQWDIAADDKLSQGYNAVQILLKNLLKKDEIERIVNEFNKRETKEALFAYNCDKLECDIQSKLYDEEGCVDLNNQENNPIFKDPYVKQLIETKGSWSGMWLEFGRNKFKYDDNFKEVSEYVENNIISIDDNLDNNKYINRI